MPAQKESQSDEHRDNDDRELHRRRVRRAGRRRDRGDPATRRPARSSRSRRCRTPPTSTPRCAAAVGRVRRLVRDPARRARARAAADRRRARGARRGALAGRVAERRQADRRAREEIPALVDNLRFFAGAARCMEATAAGEYLEGYTSMLRREAVGVVGQIAPWNYPLMMAIWKIGPALAAGNTVVLKPSEQTPMTAALLAQICAEHLPPGVLNVVFGHGEAAGAPLVAPSRRGDGLADRRRRDRQGDRARRVGVAEARAPRARRQGAGARVRRRRHRGRRRGREDRGLLERRAGLHGGLARARRRRRSTTTS